MTTHDVSNGAQPAREAREQVPLHHSNARRTRVETALQRYLAGELEIIGRRHREGRKDRTKGTKG